MNEVNIGFIGAGGIARAHAYSLNSLKYFYNDATAISLISVTSSSASSRENFANKYGFSVAQDLEDFVQNEKLDTIFILGPNKVHYEHLRLALAMHADQDSADKSLCCHK